MIDFAYPFAGRWLVQNSPANRVPSHGTASFATSYAIDFVPVGYDGRTARVTLSSLVRPGAVGKFACRIKLPLTIYGRRVRGAGRFSGPVPKPISARSRPRSKPAEQ